MKKYTITILVIIFILTPFLIVRALTVPVYTDEPGDGGASGVGGGVGSGSPGGTLTGGAGLGGNGNGGTSNNNTTNNNSSNSDLFVQTSDVSNVTFTTATLNGTAGDKSANPTLPLTAYFRYSKAAISPIYCNDIYGTNMHSTGDIKLGLTSIGTSCEYGGNYPNGCNPPASENFSKQITNLTPDTTYYYCAIASNKNKIDYEGESIVKQFHTNPYGLTINTRNATNVGTDSATLNGSYSSVSDTTTYFELKKVNADGTTTRSDNIGVKNYTLDGASNIYGDLNFQISKTSYFDTSNEIAGLIPHTTYQFRAVGITNSGAEKKIVYGSTLSFSTSYDTNNNTTDTGGSTDTTDNNNNNNDNNNNTNNNTYPTCFDGIQNGDETGIDTGGHCGDGNNNNNNNGNNGNNSNFPTVTVTANPMTIDNGETSIISWNSTNTTWCYPVGNNNNEPGISGKFTTLPLTQSQSYTILCGRDDGSTVSGNTYVYVNNSTQNNFPSVSVTANPLTISSGGASIINWTSSNTISCTANTGNLNNPTATGLNNSFMTAILTKNQSYTVTCTGTNGSTTSGNAYVYVNTSTTYPTCTDGIQNGDETGIDTGGHCAIQWIDNGTWNTNTGTGTWTANTGTGGTSNATWTTLGNGYGTWTSNTGSGTWNATTGTVGSGSNGSWNSSNWSSYSSNGNGTGGNNNNGTVGIINTATLALGQTATPPAMDVVRYHEGIETVFTRQIMADITFAKIYGYQDGGDLQTFAWNLADQFAKNFGYINSNREEIRVSYPDVAAYQLQLTQNKLTVYEYYKNKIVDVRDTANNFKTASNYEYYYQKK